MPNRTNVADRLTSLAAERPNAIAVASARGRDNETITFAALERDATHIARGLVAMGVAPGDRLALLVRPGVEFVTLVFALLRSGATMVLVDAGLGKRNIVRCLESTGPSGFVAIPQAHALRVLLRKRFPNARLNVTAGRRWFWGGATLNGLRRLGESSSAELPLTTADDPAAIVFTSGSTGPPKGVLYRHETFVTQADEIQRQYGIQPGGVDLACFPLFGLFNVACGVTTVLPEMDFSRPASCDPRKLLRAARDWRCTQAFASPAVWDRLSRYCQERGEALPSLQNIFSCGAPVPAAVLRRTLAHVHPDAKMHTPYGATEALPVATIEASEVLGETAAKTDEGAGVCVGRKFDSIEWRVIRITEARIETIDGAEELPTGQIGELIVRGPQVSRCYVGSGGASLHDDSAKIADGNAIWHRMGDVGYLDEQGRFWYCGRKSHRVETRGGTLFTECVEAEANQRCAGARTALVGVGQRGSQSPVLVLEWPDVSCSTGTQLEKEIAERFPSVARVLVHPAELPVDIRHNSKINREKLAVWAARKLNKAP